MEWWLILLIIFGSLFVLMATGFPVAFCFIAVCLVGAFMLWGPQAGFNQLILSFTSSIASFSLLPAVLFILMGELIFLTGLAPQIINAMDMWVGRLPGRLSLLAIAAGTLFATFTGASIASIAMLGSTLVPQMQARGYSKEMTLGPILGSGGLAIMIPPSAVAIVVGVVGQISIAQILIAIIMPGIFMAVLFGAYTVIRCWMRPDLAPAYETPPVALSVKLLAAVRYAVPCAFIIFMVTGVIFLGYTTPSEAAATGAVASLIVAAFYRKLNWKVLKKSFKDTTRTSVMIFLIVSGAIVYSQILAFSGASQGLVNFATELKAPPIAIVAAMLLVNLILGCFISSTPITMICIPLFMPLIHALHINEVWFAAMFILGIEIGVITPPFGLGLFAMMGVAPKGITFADCVKASTPYLILELIALGTILFFPEIALWLPQDHDNRWFIDLGRVPVNPVDRISRRCPRAIRVWQNSRR